LTRGKDKTKNSNSLSRKCKPTQKDWINTSSS
jgi:hypothetical protein